MDESAVRKVVESNLEALAGALGLERWKITIRFERCQDAGGDRYVTQAQCDMKGEYETAIITLDHAEFNDDAHVIATLTHELTHIMLAPLDVYRDFAAAAVTGNPVMERQAAELWTSAIEKTVLGLERAWHRTRDYWRREFQREAKAEARAKRKR